MSILRVIVAGDTFGSVWPELAARHGLELRLESATAAVSPNPNALPPLLVIAGREEAAESDIRTLRAAGLGAPVVIGSLPDHRLAVALLRFGAQEYFALPGDLDLLDSAIAALVDRSRSAADRIRLLDTTRAQYDFSEIIGRSAPVRAALERAARIIPHDKANVLITGETGTGKELVARAIHFKGPRATGPFVDINCAAIPGNLLESELFGYERGAFTDARGAKPGLFEAAHGGTLFLDEIAHLPVELQGKLLRAIDEKSIRRLGSLESRSIDVRIVAATHVVLERAVERDEFREDLYYRLSVIPIHLPPLRERGDDILLLSEHFLKRLSQQYDLPVPPVDQSINAALLGHAWPGNVRELRNALERALLLGDGGLYPSDLFPNRTVAIERRSGLLPFPASMDVIEREAARRMVLRFEGNKSAAAAALGISRSRLYRLLEEEDEEELSEDPEASPSPRAG
ncbi:MAG: AAA domain-containing protein [Gemmatimonas sp.]|nr:AAA domain-containing protein [Gemmatimonas sp.]